MQGQGQDSVVKRIEYLGDQTRLHLIFKGHELVTLTETHTTLKTGDIVQITTHRPFYFDANGVRISPSSVTQNNIA